MSKKRNNNFKRACEANPAGENSSFIFVCNVLNCSILSFSACQDTVRTHEIETTFVETSG